MKSVACLWARSLCGWPLRCGWQALNWWPAAATSWTASTGGSAPARCETSVRRLPNWPTWPCPRGNRRTQTVARLRQDMAEFIAAHKLEHVVVVNLASTEPRGRCGRIAVHVGRAGSVVVAAILRAAGQFALCDCRVGPGLFVHQLHAVAGGDAGGHRRVGPAPRRPARRPRRQDGRDAAEERAGPDVRPAEPASDELGRPQHLRQHGRPRAGRSGQQAGENRQQRPPAGRNPRLPPANAGLDRIHPRAWAIGRRPGTTSISPASWARP